MTKPLIEPFGVIFNGPPGCGKDSAVEYLQTCGRLKRQPYHMMFKDKLFDITLTIFNIGEDRFFELYNNRVTKNLPTSELRGFSPRAALIFVSENVIKPNFDKSFFGDALAKDVQAIIYESKLSGNNTSPRFLISDGGFKEEIQPLYDALEGRLAVVRITRPGCTYEGDSRGFLTDALLPKGTVTHDIVNDGSLESFYHKVLFAFARIEYQIP